MNGIHLLGDLHSCRCPPSFLLDAPSLEQFCVAACARHGLTVVGRFFHQFTDSKGNPAGVTGTVVLAESHLAIHTWPEIAGATLDVYVCNFSADNSQPAHQLFAELIATLKPENAEKREIVRGELLPH